MKTLPVSIFNDVLGPVMRGPSSSHTAASVRIASLARMLLGEEPRKAVFSFSRDGSLATTHEGQGTDMGLAAGLAGIGATSPDLLRSMEIAADKGIEIIFEITDTPSNHPNTYGISLTGVGGAMLEMTALSTGGGMLAVTELDSFPVAMYGDLWEVFYYTDAGDGNIASFLDAMPPDRRPVSRMLATSGGRGLLNLKFAREPDTAELDGIARRLGIGSYRYAAPVLPVLSDPEGKILFTSAAGIERLFDTDRRQLWEIGLEYEASRGNLPKETVWEQMSYILDVMRESVATGLAGTRYDDRILGSQSGKLGRGGRGFHTPLYATVARYVTAVMETKSSFGTIVAAPTAGSCGALPGTVLGCAVESGLGNDDCIKALLAAGVIGVLIAARSTFSAEVAGCQAECGSASGMAAAAVVQLAGGSASEALRAASFALQNVFGMVCDPVAGRVEVPCLGKNILAATNAITAANLILDGMDAVIPLDETIAAMDSVGRSLPFELRCTGLGGLSVTPTSVRIEEELKSRKPK